MHRSPMQRPQLVYQISPSVYSSTGMRAVHRTSLSLCNRNIHLAFSLLDIHSAGNIALSFVRSSKYLYILAYPSHRNQHKYILVYRNEETWSVSCPSK